MRRADLAIAAIAVAIAAAVKLHAGQADAAALDWLLRPTVRMVELLSGSRFELEPGQGYLCRESRFLVIPACAGASFLAVAFASAVLSHLGALRRLRDKLALLVGAALAAYALTLVANAARIVIAIQLHERRASWGWFTPHRLHEVAGVIVYLSALVAFSFLSTRGLRAARPA